MDIINQFFSALQAALQTSVENNAVSLINVIPNLFAAIIIIVIGWLIGLAVARVIQAFLNAINFEKILKSYKISDALGKVRISKVIVKLTEYYIILIFLQEAVSLVGLGAITDFLQSLLAYAPVLIGATVIFVLSAIIGELLKEKIIALEPKSKLTTFTGKVMKLILIFLGLIVGFSTMGFDMSVIAMTFITILQGIVYGIALALGIAFGLGGQDTAKDILKKAKDRIKL